MLVALALFAYAMFLPLVVAPAMHRHRIFDRSPNLGILAWQALVVSTLLAIVLGGLALLVPSVPVSSGLADFFQACAMAIRSRYTTPAGAALGGFGLALALSLLLRIGYHLIQAEHTGRRRRGTHRATLALAGHRGPQGMTILEHSAPAAYCVPGWHHRIVLTTGALEALSAEQLHAVLAHERAHLRNRHHLVLMSAGALVDAFPHSRTARTAHAEIARLVELAADDAAVRNTGRLPLAEALLTLHTGRTPAATLAAGGTTTAARVRRLIDATPSLRFLPVLVGAGLATLVLVLPIAVAVGPALAAIAVEHCPTISMTCL